MLCNHGKSGNDNLKMKTIDKFKLFAEPCNIHNIHLAMTCAKFHDPILSTIKAWVNTLALLNMRN